MFYCLGIGQQTESIKAILKREGFNIFRKGGEKLEWAEKKQGPQKDEIESENRKR